MPNHRRAVGDYPMTFFDEPDKVEESLRTMAYDPDKAYDFITGPDGPISRDGSTIPNPDRITMGSIATFLSKREELRQQARAKAAQAKPPNPKESLYWWNKFMNWWIG